MQPVADVLFVLIRIAPGDRLYCCGLGDGALLLPVSVHNICQVAFQYWGSFCVKVLFKVIHPVARLADSDLHRHGDSLAERFFGANVMVSVATQKASNPVHTVANKLSLPGLQLITKKLELPVKLVFPRSLMGGLAPGSSPGDYMMLGLGDMAIPGMLLALVLSFDYRKIKDMSVSSDMPPSKQQKYVWYALTGYGAGLVTALAAGILSQSPQPALLYLVGVAW
ncbi:hypothetical protein E2562_017717 [Oryza meyeriana var. granulata]|uniref:Uncharacterized protein n=1 Tax=Oryza meyeriana var. granulata TaxID=110450 RepID=A0A6G1BYM1_9ORYZ|nr:hypothetical protein E2562_017717 [Oryza meyeriana var. granulata]